MKFTLYVQRNKGKQIEKPKPLAGVSFDTRDHKIHAWQGESCVAGPLLYHDIQLCADGILVLGIEEHGKAVYYQHWWLVGT